MKTIAITNQKGGVSKSTTAAQFVAYLAKEGYRTIAIDLDAQMNLTHCIDAEDEEEKPDIADVLTGKSDIKKAIIEKENYALIRSSKFLSNTTNELNGADGLLALKKALAKISKNYDYCIIDTAPSLSILSLAAIAAADYVIIPTLADQFSIDGIYDLFESIEAVKQENQKVKVAGIVMTKYNPRLTISKLAHHEIERIAKNNGSKVYKATIREAAAIREAQALGQDIFTYAPKSNVAQDYERLFKEILKDLK